MSLLLNEIYGELNGIQDWMDRAEYIMHRAILTPLNNDVDEINKEISTRFLTNTDGSPITIHKYYSADTVLDHDQVATYPTEYLNKLNLSGLLPHCLELFVGCPIILMRPCQWHETNHHQANDSFI